MTCSRSSSPIVNATVSAMAPLWAQGGHFYFGETGHLHLGPTCQRRIIGITSTRAFVGTMPRIRVATPEQLEPLIRRIEDDPRFALGAERETAYYAKQSE